VLPTGARRLDISFYLGNCSSNLVGGQWAIICKELSMNFGKINAWKAKETVAPSGVDRSSMQQLMTRLKTALEQLPQKQYFAVEPLLCLPM
jgi:hypothetical protein